MTITSQNSRFEMNVPFSELEHWLTDYFLVITSVIFVQPRYSVLTCNLPIERLLLDVSFAHVCFADSHVFCQVLKQLWLLIASQYLAGLN